MTPDTILARLHGAESMVRHVADLLTESYPPDEIAVATFEDAVSWSLEAHFVKPPREEPLRALIAGAAGPQAAASLVIETLTAKDWVKSSLEGLKPVAAGCFVVHGAHDRDRVPAGRIRIEIEAALAFGTGHHGTTRGCLLALDHLLRSKTPNRILDIGTGSGILAIAAARALRRPVLASDIDASAVSAARENAGGNHLRAWIEIIHARGLHARQFRDRAPYELIFANILVGPLKTMAAPACSLLARGGRIILSGLLPGHANAIICAYCAQGLALERRIQLDEWVTLVMRRGRANRRPHPKQPSPRRGAR